jgi:hypothetical protein
MRRELRLHNSYKEDLGVQYIIQIANKGGHKVRSERDVTVKQYNNLNSIPLLVRS